MSRQFGRRGTPRPERRHVNDDIVNHWQLWNCDLGSGLPGTVACRANPYVYARLLMSIVIRRPF